jgi:hypothetical protein
VCLLVSSSRANAQARYSGDFTFGGTRGSSSAYVPSTGTGYGTNILLARASDRPDESGLVLGLALSADGGAARDLLCRPDGLGGCVPSHREIASLTALAGWRITNGLRVFAGPALAQEEQTTIGLAARIDLAVPSRSRVAITTNVRGLLLPSLRGEMYQIVSFGVGLRFQQRP